MIDRDVTNQDRRMVTAMRMIVLPMIVGLLMGVFLDAARADEVSSSLEAERRDLVELLTRQRIGLAVGQASLVSGKVNLGSDLYMPKGTATFFAKNIAALDAVIAKLAPGKPLTRRALESWRERYYDLPGAHVILFANILLDRGVAKRDLRLNKQDPVNYPLVGAMGTVRLVEWNISADGRVTGGSFPRVDVDEARFVIDQTVALRVPELKVQFRLGEVVIDASRLRARWREVTSAMSAQKELVAKIERAIARAEESLAPFEARFQKAMSAETDRLALELDGLDGDHDAQTRAWRRSEIRMRNMAIESDVLRETLQAEKKRLEPAQIKLAELTAKAAEALAAMPDITEIKTEHALLKIGESPYREIARIDEHLSEHLRMSAELEKIRRGQSNVLRDAVAAADLANAKLSVESAKSYLAQATAQIVAQIGDAAIASRGNPYAFVAMAGTQAIANATIDKPVFYDAKLDEGEKISLPEYRKRIADLTKPFTTSAETTFVKTGGETFLKLAGRETVVQSVRLSASRAVLRSTRRQLGKNLANIARVKNFGRSPNLLGQIVEGIVVDEMAESAKSFLAAEMQKEALRAYANAQLNVAQQVKLMQELAEQSEADQRVIAALRERRSELVRGLPSQTTSVDVLRPVVDYQKNELFEVEAGYQMLIDADPNDVKLSVRIQGVETNADETNHTFTPALLDKLSEGGPDRLEILVSPIIDED
ncbi:MAG: hypothetical protein AAFY99_05400 [Pseudomonadota bacterium]